MIKLLDNAEKGNKEIGTQIIQSERIHPDRHRYLPDETLEGNVYF